MDRRDGILSIEKENLLLSIDFKFNKSWDEMFSKFLIYYKKYKTLEISQDNEFYNELSTWIKRQIKLIKNNRLDKDKIKKYESLGIIIDRKKSLEDIWMDSYTELKQFYLDNNHCIIPNTKDYKSLYRFVQTQRTNYKNQKLNDKKIELLKEIKFAFDIWEYNYNIAKDYYLKNNHLLVDNDDNLESLRNWISMTRQNYKKNKLNEKQIIMLKEIYFPFEITACDKEWLNYYNKAKYYFQKHDNFYPLINNSYNRLFDWMLEQAYLRSRAKLSVYKFNLLNKIKFNFKIYRLYGIEKSWIKSYLKLSKIIEQNKSYYINYRDNEDVKYWIINQCKNKDSLSKRQLSLLKEIKFDFNLIHLFEIDYNWMENFNTLSNTKELDLSKSITKLPIDTVNWLYKQYPLYKSNKLSKYQINLLKNTKINKFKRLYKYIDFKWIKMYKQAYNFYKANKSYELNPFEYSENLFKWLLEQSRLYNSNRLSKLKIELLEAIYFKFDIEELSNQDRVWLKYYNKLKSFRKNYGHFEVDDCGSFENLYIWLKTQEENYKDGLLKDKYYNLLIKAGFKFNNSWNNMFDKFNIYYKLNNNSLTIHNKKNFKYKEVNRWIKKQIKLYQTNKLPHNIIKKYNDIGIDLNNIA